MFSADFIGRSAASAPPAKLNLHAAFVLAGDDLREPTLYSVFGPNPGKPGSLLINTEYEAELALRLKYEDYDASKSPFPRGSCWRSSSVNSAPAALADP